MKVSDMRSQWLRACILGCCMLSASVALGQGVVISEFMASNMTTLQDEDGDYSDWIELYNTSDRSILLSGWHLTDNGSDQQRWRLPAVTMDPGEFLIIFASGKDRQDPASELHTNFKLSTSGETLMLTDSIRRVASRYPDYPEQQADSSYGALMNLETKNVVAEGAIAKYFIPENNDLADVWMNTDFDDADWASGETGIGYDAKDVKTYEDLIKTDIGEVMLGVSSTVYLRIPFQLTAEDLSRSFVLRAKYEDGLGVLLNGELVAFRNITRLTRSARALERSGAAARSFESIPLDAPGLNDQLVEGENVLAILVANRSRSGDDLLCVPELDVVRVESVDPGKARFYSQASPGRPNFDPRLGVMEPPTFSHDGGILTDAISLELLSADPEARIYYTTNGTLPTESSTLYEGPIDIPATSAIAARVFRDGYLPSPIANRNFVLIRENFEVDSNLPVFVVSANGLPGGTFTKMGMMLFDRNEEGRTTTSEPPAFTAGGVIKTRGSSTGGRQKASYSFEIQDEFGDDKDVNILNFPSESDYILYAAFNFDRAHMRNAFIYELSNQIGRYAVRTQFCEVYVTRNGSALSANDYRGVYTFMEKIKRGPDRVDVEELDASHTGEDLTGGYMVKFDRLDPGDQGFSAAGGGQIGHVYPKEEDITPEQKDYLEGFFADFNRSLTATIADDPEQGFRNYIDEFSWIEHHLINEFTKNPDGLRLSTYLFKTRNGPLENGPVWDFDRCLGPDDDGRAANPVGWMGPRSHAWWGRLLTSPSYLRNYKLRWQELRAGPMQTDNLLSIIDAQAEEIGEAGGRDALKWRQVVGQAGWEREVDQLKSWVTRRVAWMDTQLVVAPEFSHEGGRVERGFEVSISAPVGDILYTTDGTDPQANNGDDAKLYDGELIRIDVNTQLRARVRLSGSVWSPPSEAFFVTDVPTIAFTEIHYNPEGEGVEFLELHNFGGEAVDLSGLSIVISRRVRQVFEEGTIIGAGEYFVIPGDVEEFQALYGKGIPTLGDLGGTLSNSRATITMTGSVNEPLFDVSYDDDWYPETDGSGPSLVLIDPTTDYETWSAPEAWRASSQTGGSPGAADEPAEPALRLHGDLDSNGIVNLTDSIASLQFLFQGTELPCDDAEANLRLADVNGDEQLNLTDAVYGLRFLFLGGPAPTLGTECSEFVGCPAACE